MEAEEAILEEGEIESENDSDSQIYVPLKRPTNYAADVPQKRFPVNQQYSSEEELQSSDCGSDSDTSIPSTKKPKRKKLHPKPKPLQKFDKLKKYDIWSTRAQEDVLSETLISCDVTLKDRSRSVESYDFSLARKYYEEMEEKEGLQKGKGYKRTRNDRKNNHFKPRSRSKSNENEAKGKPRLITDLGVDANDCDNAEIARDIANKLCEEREDLILKVIEAMGKQRTLEFFNETRRIEKEGGMLIMNGIRRRTPGGVFFYLVRNDDHITLDQKNTIFDEEKQKYKEKKKEERKLKRKAFREKTGLKDPPPKPNLPDLLTRAELIANQKSSRESEGETDAQNCTNPPPTPESDHLENWDAMESPPQLQPHTVDTSLEETRGKLKSYDDDFLDIGGTADMELF